MRAMGLLAVLLAFCVFASRVEASPLTGGCTYEELQVLQLQIGFDGWVEWNVEAQAVAASEIQRACGRVPSRWRWVNRSFNQSTRFVDRLYPGSWLGAWERRCASSEGGHGAWVPNRAGSGAGGWLQFMSGTFYGIIDSAIAHARRHGVRVPSWARSWYSPLGQALAGAEMLFHGRRGEWTGSSC